MSDHPKQQLQGFIVGALVAGAIAAGFLLSRQSSQPPPTPGPMANAPGPSRPMQVMPTPMPAMPTPPPAAQPPPELATPRAQADALFNEVMMASESNDLATIAQVLPGALAAYRALETLDDDGTFHVAMLQLAGGRFPDARATAETLLAKNPRHLLALAVSMRASVRAGDTAAARGFAKRLLDAYDSESGRALPEYQDHGRVLPTYRAEAQAAVQ